MNPFKEKAAPMEESLQSWQQLYPKAYDKKQTDPYTKTRIILMNGTEYEANWFSHQMARHVTDNDLRRDLAMARYVEKQQQIKLSLLKPQDETPLEHTIAYEQLAVDLTAELAKKETDCNVKKALDFALLEDFDHLYRYADLLEMQEGVEAERLVGGYTEIMPARPTIAHHRFPMDNVKKAGNSKKASVQTVLNAMIITAAEQQTMNYYMNITAFAPSETARKLYQEIAMVEEEHVTQYESLIDSKSTWLEMLLWHEYCECYLYWSCYKTEVDGKIKVIWEKHLEAEIGHLHKAAELLKKYEKKEWQQVIADGEFPAPISLHENVEYVRNVLKNTVQFTGDMEGYTNVKDLPKNANFFLFQEIINGTGKNTPSHLVIKEAIAKNGSDYRYEVSPTPVSELADRKKDNICVGIKPDATQSTDFTCNKA
jgi:rubrerythrin